jgi:drug/metabolite transporter (DMT)-like permease
VRSTLLLFAAVALLWGMPYLFIRVAVEDLSPFVVAWARVALAALVLVPLAGPARVLALLRARPRALLAFAAVQFAAPFALIAAGEEHVSSSLTGLLVAAEPLLVAALAPWLDPSQRPGRAQLAGLAVGLGGVAVLVGGGGEGGLAGAAAILLATALYAASALALGRVAPGAPPLRLVAAALPVSALLLAPAALATAPARAPGADTLAALAALALLCTALAFPLWFALIARAGAARAALITYVSPVVALVLGAAVLDEPVGPEMLAGLVLVLAGCRLAAAPQAPSAVRKCPPAARTAKVTSGSWS